MIKKVSAFGFIIFLLSLSIAYSATIDIYYLGSDQEISYINENNNFVADLVVTTPAQENAHRVEIEELDTPPRFHSDCLTGCTLQNVVVQPDGETDQTYTVVVEDSNGNELSSDEVTVSFSSDTENPEGQSLETSVCDDEVCYVSPTAENHVSMELSSVPSEYSRADVWVSFLGNQYKAVDCSGSTCDFIVDGFSCSDGQALEIRSHGDTKSNAGNAISNTVTQDVVCIAENPNIQTIDVTSSRDDGILTVGDSFTVRVDATHGSSNQLRMEINASEIGIEELQTTSCEPVEDEEDEDSDEFTCEIDMTSELQSPMDDGRLDITVTDIVGNKVGQSTTIDLAMEEDTPDSALWEFENYNSPITSLNRRNMRSERSIPAEFTFSSTRNNVEISDIRFEGGCEALHNPGSNDINRIRFSSVDGTVARGHVEFAGGGDRDNGRYSYSRVDYKCPIQIQSRTPSRIFSSFETVNVTLSLDISDDPFVSGGVQGAIDASLHDIEKMTNKIESWQGSFAMISEMCRMYGFGNLAVMGVATASEGVNIANAATGGMLSGPAETVGRTKSRMQNTMDDTLGQIKLICDFAACQSEVNQWGPNAVSSALGSVTDGGSFLPDTVTDGLSELGVDSYADTLDPYQNKHVAWISACLPAISYHTAIEREIECNYVDCLSNQVRNLGVPAGYCGFQREQMLCRRNARSIQSLIPGFNLLDNVKRELASVLENPVESALAGLVTAGCKYMPDTLVGAGACTAVETFAVFGDVQNILEEIDRLRRGPDELLGGESACDVAIDLDNFQVKSTEEKILEALQEAFGDDSPRRALEINVNGQTFLSSPGTIILPDGTRARYDSAFGDPNTQLDPNKIYLLGPDGESGETFADRFGVDHPLIDAVQDREQQRWTRILAEYDTDGSYRRALRDYQRAREARDRGYMEIQREITRLEGLKAQTQSGRCAGDPGLGQPQPLGCEWSDENEEALQNAREQAEDLEGYEEASEELSRQNRDLDRDVKRDALVGSWGRMTRSFIGAQRGARFLSPLIGGIAGFNLDSYGFSNIAESVMEFDPFVDAMCRRDFNVEDATGDRMRPRTSTFSATGSRSSSYVTATMLEIEGEYEYYVRNMVGQPKQALTYSVLLESGGSPIDITEEMYGTPTVAVQQGEVHPTGGEQRAIGLRLDERRERVCIQFHLDEHIGNYFDDVSGIEGDKFCQLVVEE